ncbi:ATP-binding protein [Mucilaginibacter sp. L196]|uniref:ATP-binding protein n=1 Tax=Mucilaginibacter sp. L196 TaxID=1641870 RepID=UPI00157734BE|nr:ATP-binding protein [Mucilaginibacter sp. L196]
MDYSKYEKEPAIPEASSMIETFRAIGYSIEAAVADVIDNSISADAKNIWVSFEWKGEATWLSIKDDGNGMNSKELVQAMRPGSKNPLAERGVKDLGRFGLGLKTASFSQCRVLSAISKKTDSDPAYWTWDLDFVKDTGNWDLLKYIPETHDTEILSDVASGTIIVWNDIDRLVQHFHKDDTKALDKFLVIMEQIKKHLSMVFHRFIESGKVKIWFQDRPVLPWNPFLTGHGSTQPQSAEHLQNGKVFIKGFVLPHKSKLTEDEFRNAEGPRGWNEQQGFYIYRNERLLLAGDWLGMYRKEEHYKLARIQVDLPNSLDAQWQIDIKKSVARPPLVLRDQLKAYAGRIRNLAVEVYRHKGRTITQIPGQKFVPLWVDHKRGDKWYYKINREHPLVKKTEEDARLNPGKAIDLMLRFIEETIPTKSIFIKESEEPEQQGKPFATLTGDPVKETLDQFFAGLLNAGKSSDEAKRILINIEPFNYYPHLIELL